MADKVDHQFSLFGHQPPKKKLKITREQVLEAKRLYDKGEYRASANKIRDIREALEQKYGV